jgi:hypothetical protein
LTAHIAKICHGVTTQEREKFIAEVQLGKSVARAKKAPPVETHAALPELSGLEALAEVSRHHGQQQSLPNDLLTHAGEFINHSVSEPAMSLPPNASSMPSSTMTPHGLDLPDLRLAALRALVPNRASLLAMQLEPVDGLVDYGHGEAPNIGMNYSRHGPDSVLPPAREDTPEPPDDLVDYSHGQPPVIDDEYARHQQVLPLRDNTMIVTSEPLDPPLAQTAVMTENPNQDPMTLLAGFVADQDAHGSAEVTVIVPPISVTSDVEQQTYPFASGLEASDAHFQMWSPAGATPSAPKKVRGAFAPDRRTAVKEVRKKGACLRCRMLKKSCDSADPCKECAKLENARMWKGQCVRTRLAHIFNVFSSTLFMSINHRVVENLRTTNSFTNLPGRLEVSYFPNARLSITFPCLRLTTPEHAHADIIINTENEGIGVGSTFDSKISQYGARLLAKHFDPKLDPVLFGHVSKFMYHTLKVATTMKACTLISRAVDLWVCVTLLKKGETELLAIHEPQLPPSNVPVDLGHSAMQRSEGVHYIYIQLRRKLERSCDVHFRAIMTELEKSLIQRKQADNFETFLGTVILLRSLELVGYMYKGWDHLVDPSIGGRKDGLYGVESWPLENSPGFYWQQGEQFSDLLVSMLRLRKVIPAMRIQDGQLRANSVDKDVRDWFEAMELRADFLQFARDKPYDNIDGNSWELRWMGKLFET